MRMRYLAAASAVALAFSCGQALAADPAPATDGPVHYGTWGVDLTSEDHSIAPGDDFFMYGDGAWFNKAVIPADQTSTGVSRAIYNRAQVQLRSLIEISARDPKTPTARQVGGLYKAFMDESRIEALDDKPLRPVLARIAEVRTKDQFLALMAKTNGDFGTTFFGIGVLPDPAKPEINTLGIFEAGLGLPDREYYFDAKFKPQLAAYRAYVERTLTMIGYKDPAVTADAILALETKMADANWLVADNHDIAKLLNPMTLKGLQAYAPGVDWKAYLAAAGVHGQETMIVGQNTAIQKLAKIYADTPLETLKAWQTFHTTRSAAPYLSKRFVDSDFQFNKALSGVPEQEPRWKRGVTLTETTLGEAVGREYVAHFFPPESKAKMKALVGNLKTALAARIQKADWLAASTKQEAMTKLSKMDVQVGYPDKWRDYSALKIDGGDLLGDVERSQQFEWAYQLGDLGKPVDHKKWGMTPQTVNAYNGGLENKIVFPAAILQAPFFDPTADDAANYGAIGAVIGHEITHGFDNSGRHIDATGKQRDWWTAADAQRFEAEAKKFGEQYDTYEPVPGSHINGKLTMGENIADLGGLLVALDAYHASLHGQPAPVIDGLTGDQRFFLAFAQAWERKDRDEALRRQIATNEHSPAKFRVIGPTRNIDAWYAAFGVTGGKYYLKPEDRVRIW